MNLRQIEVFRAVMLTGSITHAAQLLHVSQPGISRLVRHLEIRLGVPLFDRRKGRLLATPEARALYAEIEKMYGGVKTIQDFAAGLKTGLGSALRVITSPSTGLELAPMAVSKLGARYPMTRLSLEVVSLKEMVDRLLAETSDIAISTLRIDHPMLELRPVGEWTMVCVFPKDHPLEAKRRVSVRDVLSHRLVAFDPETVQGRIIEDWFRKQRFERKVSVEVRSGHTACALVASGAGVAFVDNLTARAHTSGALVSRPVSRSPVFAIYLVTNRNRPVSVVAKQLSIEVEKCFKEMRRDNKVTVNR